MRPSAALRATSGPAILYWEVSWKAYLKLASGVSYLENQQPSAHSDIFFQKIMQKLFNQQGILSGPYLKVFHKPPPCTLYMQSFYDLPSSAIMQSIVVCHGPMVNDRYGRPVSYIGWLSSPNTPAPSVSSIFTPCSLRTIHHNVESWGGGGEVPFIA